MDNHSKSNVPAVFELVAALIGLVAFHITQGIRLVHPLVFDHIIGHDVSQSTTGWLFFQRASWEWPIGLISGFLYPLGATIGYTDTYPLFSVLMKLVLPSSPLLQISGLWLALCYVLTGVFSFRLARRMGSGPAASLAAAAIGVTCPVLISRWVHHSLMAHWIVLAALASFLSEDRRKTPWIPRASELLIITAGFGTHPYLGLMVLSVLVARQMTGTGMKWVLWCAAAIRSALLTVTGFLVLLSFGYFSIDVLPVGGFGHYNAPLFALFDSQNKSRFVPGYDYLAHGDGAYEGYAWLGPGGLILLAAALFLLWSQGRESRPDLGQRPRILLITCLLLFVVAMGSHIKVGDHVIATARSFYGHFDFLTSNFRASGRLIWPLYYFVLIGSVAVVGRSKIPRLAKTSLLAGAIVLQILDQYPYYRQYSHLSVSPRDPSLSRFRAPVWGDVGSRFQHVSLIPPQLASDACYVFGRPNSYTEDYYFDFAWLAASRGATVNSGSHARVSAERAEAACKRAYDDLSSRRFDPSTLYIVEANYLAQLGMTEDGLTCSPADGFHVCYLSSGESASGFNDRDTGTQ